MKTLVKICGITDCGFAMEADRLGVDFLGFIFHGKSPRNISVENAKEIRQRISCRAVGVFVLQKEAEIRKIAEEVGLDVIQLHGIPDPVLAENLRKEYEVWQVIKDESGAAFPADALLVDSATPGSGQRADWGLAETLIGSGKKVVLAGGLSSENCADALKIHPYVLDFNSSLETEPGKKSIEKLHKLIKELKK